jgi:hypothetical protein
VPLIATPVSTYCAPTWHFRPTYCANCPALARKPGVKLVQPIGQPIAPLRYSLYLYTLIAVSPASFGFDSPAGLDYTLCQVRLGIECPEWMLRLLEHLGCRSAINLLTFEV